jgi:GntR family transcriptional regulator
LSARYASHQAREYRSRMRERTLASGMARQRSARRIYGLIRSGIRLGAIAPDQHLVEADLVAMYATTRSAVREALALLAEDGLVTRVPHDGTVVVGSIAKVSLEDGRAWLGSNGMGDRQITDLEVVQVESAEVPTSAILQSRLQIRSVRDNVPKRTTVDDEPLADPGDRPYLVVQDAYESDVPATVLLKTRLQTEASQVRMSEYVVTCRGEPFKLLTAYSHLDYPARVLSLPDLGGRFAQTFADAYGSPLARIDTSVEAIACDSRTSKLLSTPVGSPILCRERLLIDANDRPQEFSFTYYPGRKVALESSTVLTSD